MSRKSGKGRPAGIARPSSSESLAAGFDAKEASDWMAARVVAARAANAPTYQGEQRAWGGARPFNPVKDDFLQMVERAIDARKQNTHS